tara:strand:+ start:876 stop:1610 length:735 start_codon:yes stop_codon:yes gene_type:complete
MAYEDYLQHRKSLIDLGTVVRSYATRLVPALPRDSVDNFAGALRDTLPGFITEFGSVAGSIGVDYYSSLRSKSGVAGRFIPTIAPLNASAAANTAVSFLAKTFVDKSGNITNLQTNLGDELQRSVVGIERDTIFTNSINDTAVTLYQRVASADSCEFCSMVAFDPELTREYPTQYHRNCFCTVEPVFRGQSAIRPDYYDGFSEQYYQAVGQLDPLDRSTENILAKVREIRTSEDVAADLRAAGQ